VPLGYRCVDKKLEIVPEESEAVGTIFSLYLELGSMGALLAELDRRGIRTKVNGRRESQKRGGIRFGVGPLAHLLKNRFYIGEVHYRGEVYRGEHEPILSRDVFDAVQAKLAANAVDRQVRLKGLAALLAGRLFDDRGNRMSPAHANKKGVRYRYYVSQALLQNRKGESGSMDSGDSRQTPSRGRARPVRGRNSQCRPVTRDEARRFLRASRRSNRKDRDSHNRRKKMDRDNPSMGRPFAPKQSRSRPTTPHLARPRPNMLLCVSLRPPHSHLRRSYFGRWNIRELHWHLAAEWVSLPKTLSPRLAVSSESEHDRRSTSQSIVICRSPMAGRLVTARRLRPIGR
jgi:hypothetical protein